MNKYYGNTNISYNDIEGQLMPDESIIWKGGPKKSAFIINSSITMMPFALLWLAFDSFFILTVSQSEGFDGMGLFFIGFFAFHLMPVWIWLYNVITAYGRWKNSAYAVTNKRIIIRNGLIGYQYNSIYYTDISNVSLHVGVIDRILGVGDVRIATNHTFGNTKNGNTINTTSILDVTDPQHVMSIVQKTVLDIQTDIHYPNALRPDVNPGYHTEYRP